jgi:hypothetical protein
MLWVLVCGGVFIIGHSPLRPKPFSDGYFHAEAKGLRKVIWSGDLREGEPIVHSPGVPFFYLPAYVWLQEGASERLHWYSGVGWNCVILWLSALLLGHSAERLGGDVAGRIAELAVPVSFFPLYYSAGIGSESAAFLGSAMVVWAGVRLANADGTRWRQDGLLLGVALALLISMRGNYAFTAGFVLCAGLLSSERKIFYGTCLAASVGVLLSLAVFRGVDQLNRAMGTAARQDGFLTHVLIQGAFQYRTEPFDWRPWEKEARAGSADYAAYAEVRKRLGRIHEESGAPMARLEWEWLLQSLKQEPHVWLKMAPIKVFSALWFRISPVRIEKVLGSGTRATLAALGISVLLNTPLLLMLAIAAWAALRTSGSDTGAVLMAWAPFLGGLLFVAMTYSEPRYMVPGTAGVIVLSAAGTARLLRRCGGKEPEATREPVSRVASEADSAR